MNRIGIDIGGSKISLGLVDNDYNIISKIKIETRKDSINEDIIENIFEILNENQLSTNDIELIGIGAPGSVDLDKEIVKFCPNLSIRDWNLSEKVSQATGIRTIVDNDANCATYGEYLSGCAKGYKNVIGLTIGTGIGAGILINGKIYRGSNYSAGEIGHMVISFDGNLCNCGKKGCFETYASASALIEQTKKAIEDNNETLLNKFDIINGKTPFDAMKHGDKIAASVVNTYISYLSIGILNIIDIFSPDLIFIGGGISNEGDFLIKRINLNIDKYNNDTLICTAALKNNAGIIGAAYINESL